MTSRERVRAAVEHREPDRTPLFERIIKSPHSDALLGRPCAATNFRYRMELLADGAFEELCLNEARDKVDLGKLLGFDMIALGANGLPPAERPVRVGPRSWRTGNTVATEAESGWVRHEPLEPAAARSEDELARELEAWLAQPFEPLEMNPDELRVFREAKRLMAEEGLDWAIYCSCYAIPVCTLPPHQLIWLHTRPELMRGLYARYSDGIIARVKQYADLGADIIGLGGDMADDSGPFISPAHYREFVMPEIRRQAEAVHALSLPATNTSDGNLWPVLDDFLLGTGVDGFGEIDCAAGMDLRRLKERLGDRIFFLGNLDIRFVLTRGTVEESRAHMVECVQKGWGNGGHIIMTSNVVHEGVRLENYLACLEAYRDHFGVGD